jgi:ssDNA-binding Zn-finger/Zn-ribbon topoisomerase 1
MTITDDKVVIYCPNCDSANFEVMFKIKNYWVIVYDFCPDCKFTEKTHTIKLNTDVGRVLDVSRHKYNKVVTNG